MDREQDPEVSVRNVLSRRQFLRATGGAVVGVTTVGGVAWVVAACSPGAAPSAAPSVEPSVGAGTSPSATAAINGVTLDVIALDGEDGKKELEAWRQERSITLASTPLASWDAAFAKLKTDTFDIALVANPYVSVWAAAGVLQPIDTTRLTNWSAIYPALSEGDFLRGPDDQIYAVPIAWGDGPYIYDPAKVPTPPQSVIELLDPAWKGRLIMFDDPIMAFHTIGVAKGYGDESRYTKEQLQDVAAETRKLLANVVAFAQGYQDATDYLVRGEADLAVSGWEAMLTWAKDKNVTLDFDFLDEAHGGGWCDSMGIPTNAKDIDAAYAYIDALIAPDANAAVATNLISGTVNSLALDKVAPEAKIYDYSLVESATSPIKFEAWTPPLTADGDVATKEDWDQAWKDLRAGA